MLLEIEKAFCFHSRARTAINRPKKTILLNKLSVAQKCTARKFKS